MAGEHIYTTIQDLVTRSIPLSTEEKQKKTKILYAKSKKRFMHFMLPEKKKTEELCLICAIVRSKKPRVYL